MKLPKILLTIIAAVGLTTAANAQTGLSYTFNTDVEGFQNVAWSPPRPVGWSGLPSVQQVHTAGGWQMLLTKEFSWTPGGGVPIQQVEMQNLANSGGARLRFDVMVDATSFPSGAATWYQLWIVGNSDGAAGWTQTQLIDANQSAGQADLRTWHFDLPFGQLGWQPGDTWFQLWTGANSDAGVAVNFYLDNVVLVPEPSVFALAGLGAAALLIFRRR
jgi:hypothetical protein